MARVRGIRVRFCFLLQGLRSQSLFTIFQKRVPGSLLPALASQDGQSSLEIQVGVPVGSGPGPLQQPWAGVLDTDYQN